MQQTNWWHLSSRLAINLLRVLHFGASFSVASLVCFWLFARLFAVLEPTLSLIRLAVGRPTGRHGAVASFSPIVASRSLLAIEPTVCMFECVCVLTGWREWPPNKRTEEQIKTRELRHARYVQSDKCICKQASIIIRSHWQWAIRFERLQEPSTKVYNKYWHTLWIIW